MPRISRYYFVFVLVIFFSNGCKKDQLHWKQVTQLNGNASYRLNNVKFITDQVCIAAGGIEYTQSDILVSVNGGYTWSHYSDANAPKELYCLNVAHNGTIYLGGVDGNVLHSTDSGKTWQFSHIGNWLAVCGGGFTSHDTGIFVNRILNRQSTITRVNPSFDIIDEQTFLFGLNVLYMTDPAKGYAAGYGAVMKTTNGGTTWNFQDVKGDNFTAMDIHGDEIWMCGSNGGIYHTYDGGNKWTIYRNGNDISLPTYLLRCILFKDASNGWAVGDDGVVIYSKDGGKHWSEYERFTKNNLRSAALCPDGDLLVAGDNGALFRVNTN